MSEEATDPRDARIAELEAENAALREQIGRLEALVLQDSSNSSRPPSTDGPASRAKRKRRKRSTRQRGGQPGHEGHHRAMLDPSQVDHFVACIPHQCAHCHKALEGVDASPQRHQRWELPPIRPTVTEYHLHTLACSCGHKTKGSLPEGMDMQQFGPRVQATAATLRADGRMSLARTRSTLHDLFGLTVSTATLSTFDHRISEAMAPAHEELHEAIKSSEVAHLDETTWYLAGKRMNLWCATNPRLTLLLARPRRDGATARELVGAGYEGVGVTDRYCAYHWLDPSHRQMCWAHLKRDFARMAMEPGDLGVCGELLERTAGRILSEVKARRTGKMTHEELAAKMETRRGYTEALLAQAGRVDEGKVSGMAREMLKHRGSLWTFARVEGVEPTNNRAERTLRHPVILRKTSFGSQSERGLRWVERVLSVRDTLRKQGRSLHDFLLALLLGSPQPLLS